VWTKDVARFERCVTAVTGVVHGFKYRMGAGTMPEDGEVPPQRS